MDARVCAKLENLEDVTLMEEGRLPPEAVRTVELSDARSNPQSAGLYLPRRLIDQLGLEPIRFGHANSSDKKLDAPTWGWVQITIQGRNCIAQVVEVADERETLIGKLPLQVSDTAPSVVNQRNSGNKLIHVAVKDPREGSWEETQIQSRETKAARRHDRFVTFMTALFILGVGAWGIWHVIVWRISTDWKAEQELIAELSISTTPDHWRFESHPPPPWQFETEQCLPYWITLDGNNYGKRVVRMTYRPLETGTFVDTIFTGPYPNQRFERILGAQVEKTWPAADEIRARDVFKYLHTIELQEGLPRWGGIRSGP